MIVSNGQEIPDRRRTKNANGLILTPIFGIFTKQMIILPIYCLATYTGIGQNIHFVTRDEEDEFAMKYMELLTKLQLDAETESKLRNAMREAERELLEKQKKGIKSAKEKGVVFGRPRKQVDELDTLYEKYQSRDINLEEAARLSGVSRSTIHRRFQACRNHKKRQ